MQDEERRQSPNGADTTTAEAFELKVGLATMLRGGVILDVTTPAEAELAQAAGAAAVMALERVPADIRRQGGVARMAAVGTIRDIQRAVTIPVMAKARIGHLVEAEVLEQLGVDFIDESEVLTPADGEHHIDKHPFRSPFVCGATCLAEALRRIGEGAALIRTKGEAGTGDVIEAVRHLRRMNRELRELSVAPREEWMARAKDLRAPYELVAQVARRGSLPVPNFAAGGVATPADAALVVRLGAEAVFVGSGVFKAKDPAAMAAAIVKATARAEDPAVVAEACAEAGEGMEGLAVSALAATDRLQERGW